MGYSMATVQCVHPFSLKQTVARGAQFNCFITICPGSGTTGTLAAPTVKMIGSMTVVSVSIVGMKTTADDDTVWC